MLTVRLTILATLEWISMIKVEIRFSKMGLFFQNLCRVSINKKYCHEMSNYTTIEINTNTILN